MNLIEQVIGATLGQATGGGGTQAALLRGALGLVGGGSGGGLNGLVQQLAAAGLGSAVSSWVGVGANQPVSPQRLGEALSPQQVGMVVQQSGLPQGDVLQGLAQLLPGLVDHLTPQGQVPPQDSVQQAVAALLSRLGGR